MSDLALQYFNAFDTLELPDLEILSEKIAALIFKKKAKKDNTVEEGIAFFNSIKGTVNREINAEKELSIQEGLDLLNKITGCVSENISLEDAKSEYFAEKYGIEK